MIGQAIGFVAAILSIYQFATQGKVLTLRLNKEPKIKKFGHCEVY
jgi:hypothetical protein